MQGVEGLADENATSSSAASNLDAAVCKYADRGRIIRIYNSFLLWVGIVDLRYGGFASPTRQIHIGCRQADMRGATTHPHVGVKWMSLQGMFLSLIHI